MNDRLPVCYAVGLTLRVTTLCKLLDQRSLTTRTRSPECKPQSVIRDVVDGGELHFVEPSGQEIRRIVCLHIDALDQADAIAIGISERKPQMLRNEVF